MREFVVGSRGSPLALEQVRRILEPLERLQPRAQFRLKTISTKGDALPQASLQEMGGRGIFVKELEGALLQGSIDLAVHSLKDLPSRLPPGLTIGAVPEREDPRDVLVSRHGLPLAQLPPGAIIGSGSLRRGAQLLAFRSDLRIRDIRGNLDTRLRKASGPEYDGIIVAAAGMHRLGLGHRITQYLPWEVCLPAVGQGALAVEIRAEDTQAAELLLPLDHGPTRWAVSAERAFMQRLGGGCQVPFAAHGWVTEGRLILRGLVAAPDGSHVVRAAVEGSPEEPERLAADLLRELEAQGAAPLLALGSSR